MSMADRDGLIWFDGKLVPWREANVHVLTHSLHYGVSVFEGVRAYHTINGTAIYRLFALNSSVNSSSSSNILSSHSRNASCSALDNCLTCSSILSSVCMM